MKKTPALTAAIEAINDHHMLLVFPIDNALLPLSLWSVTYPRSKMRWEWDDGGDNRVSNLWHLREVLSRSSEVVYTKWYRGRATFFSRKIFTALLALFLNERNLNQSLSEEAKNILEILEGDSPLSTKALKRASGLQGRAHEAAYNRALKELWSRFLIVGFGEVDEGAFPSLALGATKVIFEDLYRQAEQMSLAKAEKQVASLFQESKLAEKFFIRTKESLTPKAKPKIVVGPKGYVEFGA